MKIGRLSLPLVSVAVLAVQLSLVSVVAAKYLYQRWTCPRVWTRASMFDPELVMRGRYLALQLTVDGCGSTLPSAKLAQFPRGVDGAVKPGAFTVRDQPVYFQANLKVINNKLVAVRLEGEHENEHGLTVSALPSAPCDQMRLLDGVNAYIAEHAQSPLPLKPGQELWIEVTVPPTGPPRPLQLALKDNGIWKPLLF